jgi:hypothetical protein
MNNTSILVLGAGELGMPVLRNLAQQAAQSLGTTVTVLLRPSTISSKDYNKAQDIKELSELGINLLPGDLSSSVTELSDLFKRFDTVISCTGFVTGSGGLQIKLATAILDAGVKRYFPWQFGVDYDVVGRGSVQDLFNEQLDVRDLLRSQNQTEWVIVSTGMFTSFLFDPSFGIVDLENNVVHALGSWDTAVTVTTPKDIGRLTAEICFSEPRIVNTVVYTAGDTITYEQLADIVDSVLVTRVKRVAWTVPYLTNELAKDPNDSLKKYRLVFATGKGMSWHFSKTFNAEHGIETKNVLQWAQEKINRLA